MSNETRRTAIPVSTKRVVFADARVGWEKPAKFRCAKCGGAFEKNRVQVDHITEWSDGGTHDRSNLQLLCVDDHRRKTKAAAKRRGRAATTGHAFTGRVAVGVTVVAAFCVLLWAVTAAVDPAAARRLVGTYETATGLAVAVLLLFAAARTLYRRTRPVKTPERDHTSRVEEWLAKAVPAARVTVRNEPNRHAPTITVHYPAHAPTHDAAWRNGIQEKAEDLFPRAHIVIDWTTGNDRFTIRDEPDPLIHPVESLPMTDIENTADYATVDMGLKEDGSRWRLPILGSHILAGGSTGSGKSGLAWNLIRGLAPGIRDNVVVVHGIDPKGGIELGPALPLWRYFSDGEDTKGVTVEPLDPKVGATPMDAHLAVLTNATGLLRERLRTMKADGIRKIEKPSREYPLHVVIIDEAAYVLAYASDAKSKKVAQNSLEILASQGRAAGFTVICLVQDPSKEVVSIRNLLPRRIALRVDNATEVRMLLGDGSVADGARAHKIPRDLPGVGFTLTDADNRPVRFRVPFVSDAEVTALVRDYTPKPDLTK